MNEEIFNFFLNFPNLKNLKVFDTNFENLNIKLTQVKNLTIGYNVEGKWAEKFPNLKNLTINWLKFKKDLIQINEIKNLEKLKISSCCMPEISIPNVKILTLSDVGFYDKNPFKFEENKIEEIFIENCSHVEWLMEFLSRDNLRVKLVRIKWTPMSKKCEEFLKNFDKKGRKIQIVK